MIQFPCPQCNTVLKVPDDKAGKRGKCPKCGGTIAVPAASPEAAPALAPAPAPQRAPQAQAPAGKTCPLCDAPGLAPDATECPHCQRDLISGLRLQDVSSAGAQDAAARKGFWGFVRANRAVVIALGVLVVLFGLYLVLFWPVRSEASALEDRLEDGYGLKDVDVKVPAFAFSMPDKVAVTATARQNVANKRMGGAVKGWYYPKQQKVVLSGTMGERGLNYLNPNQATGHITITIHLGKKK